ncbi:MAG: glycosyl transferase [Flavobacteriaceae bacterium]|nr:glycosyl transferase [Flavobacteriaceae bacterium]
MASAPLVSIVTPQYNAAAFIEHTLESILAQTHTNWELLVVDDGSTDSGAEIVSRYADSDSRIRLHRLVRNYGAAHCRNLATEMATGDFIAFCDADDIWAPAKLEKQLAFMAETGCDVSFSNYLHIDAEGRSLNRRVRALPRLNYHKQLKNNYIGNLTGIYNANVVGKIEAPQLRKRQDWAIWLEAIRRSDVPALGLQEDLAFYRVHDSSMSANKWRLVKYNYLFYRRHLGYSFLKAVYYLLLFFWEYFMVRPRYIERL